MAVARRENIEGAQASVGPHVAHQSGALDDCTGLPPPPSTVPAHVYNVHYLDRRRIVSRSLDHHNNRYNLNTDVLRRQLRVK